MIWPKKLPRLPTMGVCTYKLLENAFAKSIKPPPVKPYTILEIKTEKKINVHLLFVPSRQ